MDNIQLTQDTISDSQEIFQRIKYELSQAQSEILIAMAWFTDPDLFDALLERVENGVKVDIIISDQEDNSKLEFSKLKDAGAEFLKIKNVGYGMMHQKFCVIDRKIAINGSYNWTVNARKNNHENVIVTTYKQTVEDLINTFFQIKNRAIRVMNGESITEIESSIESQTAAQTTSSIKADKPDLSFQEQSLKDFRDVLDNIIATEVGAFDKELLKSSGYNRALENNGDHQVLSQAMDSLYSNFINEIDVIDEKKNRLRSRIDEQQKISIGNVELRTDNEIMTIKENISVEESICTDRKAFLLNNISEAKLKKKSNNETKIPFLQSKIDLLDKKIKEISVAFVKPPVNKFYRNVLIIMCCLLLSYIIIFYSSVAYIFIFAKGDALRIAQGLSTDTSMEVFDPYAVTKIWHKGLGGIFFLFLFVSIPLCTGILPLLKAPIDRDGFKESSTITDTPNGLSKWKKYDLGFLFIVLIDAFLAYKVAKNINEVEYISNQTNHRILFWEIFVNSNFWLVFILGSLGVLFFSRFFYKLFQIYNLRSETYQQEKVKYEVSNLENDIQNLNDEIQAIRTENDMLEVEISKLQKEEDDIELKLNKLPMQLNEKLSFLHQRMLSFNEKIGNFANIYKSQVDNDKLPVSKAEMENRINIFVEGWSKYLHDKYAIRIAESKTSEAIKEISIWLDNISFQQRYSK